jgi:hypothetical protein
MPMFGPQRTTNRLGMVIAVVQRNEHRSVNVEDLRAIIQRLDPLFTSLMDHSKLKVAHND